MAKKTAPVRQDFDLSDLLKSGFDQGQSRTQQEEAPLVGPKTQRAMEGGSAAPDEDRGFFDFTGDVGKSIWQGAKGMGRRISATADAITGDNAGIVQTQAKQRADSRDDPAALKALNADIAAKKKSNPDAGWFDVIGDVLSSMSENKEGSAQLVANQVPNIAVSTGTGLAGMKGGAAIGTAIAPGLGTIIGGTLGFLGGSFLGNALLEVGGSAMEKADDGGLTDAERNQAVKEGAVKSGVITTVEGLTMGLGKGLSKTVFSGPAKAGAAAEARVLAQAGVDITKPEEIVKALAIPQLREQATAAGKTAAKAASSVKSRSAQAGGNLALQSLGEGGGEYLGTMAATGEGDKYDAILEAFSSIPGSAIETADILRTAQGNGLDPHGIVAAQKSGGIVSRAGLAATPAAQARPVAPTPPVAPAQPVDPVDPVDVTGFAEDPVAIAKAEIDALKAQPDLDPAEQMRLQFLQSSIDDPATLAELYDIEYKVPSQSQTAKPEQATADQPAETAEPPKAAAPVQTPTPATDAGVSVSGDQKREADPLASSVIDMLRNGERASPGVLTRKLNIGFNRANRILKQLEADGIVGPLTSDGSRAFLGEGKPYDAQSEQQPPTGPSFDPETGEILDAPPVSERPTDELEQQRKNAAAGSVRNAITEELNRRRELGDTEPGVMADAATNQAQQVAPEPAAEQATAAEDAPIEYHAGDLEQFKASSPKAYSVPKGILTTDITKLTDDEVLSRFGKRGIEQMADLLGAKTSGTKSQILAGVRKVLANRAKMKATTPEQIAAMGTGALRSLVSELGGNGKHLKRADLEAFANGWLDANVKMAQDKVATANLAKEVTKAARDGKSNFSDFAISKFARQIFENASPTQNPDAYDRALKAYAAKLMVPPLSSVWGDVEHFQSEAAKATGDDQQRYSDLASALEARLTSAGVERPTGAQAPDAGAAVAGEKISDEWTAFSDQTGTLGIPRAEMPQIKAEHRGAMVNFLKAKGIEATPETIPSSAIKPTQAEFSPAKVKSAMEFTGGDRAIIVSADGHVVDGHHQWLAKREKGEPIKALRLDTNIREVLDALKDMPSAQPEQAAAPADSKQFDAYAKWINAGKIVSPGMREQIQADERLAEGEAERLLAMSDKREGGNGAPETLESLRAQALAIEDTLDDSKPDPAAEQKLAGIRAKIKALKAPEKAKWLKAITDNNRLAPPGAVQLAVTPSGGITFMGDPETTKQGRAMLGAFNAAKDAGATDAEIAEAIKAAEKQAPAPAQKAPIKYQPIKLSSWQQAEVERGGTGLAGELGASTQASLLAMRNSSNVPELKVLKEYPNGGASFENPPQFKEIGQGFAVRGYNRRGTVIQDVKLPNGMVITRGLHADGALYGSAEGDYDQIVRGEGFAEAERLIADFFAGQPLPAIKTQGASAAPATAYNQAEVVKQLADAMRAGGWVAFRDLRTKISNTYNLDARQTLDLGTLTRAEVGPAYDLEYAMHDPRKAGRVAFINAEAPVAPEGLSAEQAAEWLAGWDEGAERAKDGAPDPVQTPGEVVGEAVEVVDAPRIGGGSTEELTPEQIAERAQALLPSVRRFASGLTAIGDLAPGARAAGGASLRGVGVDVGLLSKNAIEVLGNAIVNQRAAVFVDSGAFSAFRRGLKSGEFEVMDFDAIMDKYDAIMESIGRNAEDAGEVTDYPRPLLVMPDVVGSQAESLALLREHRQWIAGEVRGNLSQPIVPIQKGELSMADAYRKAVEIIGSDDFIVGIPSNEKAVTPDELRDFLADAKPKAIHILGAASDVKLLPRLMSVVAAGLDGKVAVTADASPIRSKVIRAVAAGAKRGQVIESLLYDPADPAFNRDAQPTEEENNGTEAPETIEAEAQGPQTAAADAAGIPGARFVEELTDSYSGQSNFTLTLRAEDGSTLGSLDYTVYAGQPQISMLSVPPEHRRKGYGVALAMQLQQTYPETEIDWGTLTGEGAALYNSLDFREVPSEYAAGLQRLEEAKAERDAILAEVERFGAIESPTDAQRADYYIAIEPINDLHSEIDDLEYALQGKSPVKRLIVGRKAGVVAPVPVAEEQSKAAEISPALEAAGWAPYGEMSWTRGDADGYKAYLTEDGRMVIDGYENGRPFTIGEKDVDGAAPDELVSFLAKAVEEDQKAMAEAVDEGRAPYKPSDYAVKAWREALDKFALRSYHEGSKQYAQAFAEGYMRSLDGVRVIHDGLATDVLAGRIDGAQFQGREGRQSKIDEFFDAPEPWTDAEEKRLTDVLGHNGGITVKSMGGHFDAQVTSGQRDDIRGVRAAGATRESAKRALLEKLEGLSAEAAPEVDMSADAKWRKTWAEAKAVAESLGLPTKDGKRNLKLTELVPAIERKVSESQNAVAALPADPDVFAQELSAIVGPVAQDVAAFVDGEQERDMATFRPNITPVSLPRATSADPKPAGVDFLPQAEADKVVQSWMDEAARQGKDTKLGNYNRTIISLFDASGVMSAPWEEAGYNVIRYDIQNGDDIHDFDAESLIERHGNDNVWAVIAQPPCTDFASSGAQWWAEKDAAGITEISNELVRQSMRTIELFRPPVWWLENPVGRIQKLNNLPDPLLSFDPWHFGDPWTKRTNYWGNFNNQLPQANVEPVEGSKVHKLSSSAKFERSLTPEGVAYAMFMANNAAAMSAPERMAREFHGISKEDFAAALAAGHAEYDIKSAIEDSYYENDLETVRETLADLASEGAQSGQSPASNAAAAEESTGGEANKTAPKAGAIFFDQYGTDYRVEGNDGGTVRLTKNLNKLSEQVVRMDGDTFDRLVREDAEYRAEIAGPAEKAKPDGDDVSEQAAVEDFKAVKAAVSEAIDNQLKKAKAKASRLRTQAKAGDLTKDQKLEKLMAADEADSVLRRTRQQVFNAEDAALKALETGDITPFADYKSLFPALHKDLVSRIKRKPAPATEAEVAQQDVPTLSEEAAARLGALAKMAEAGPLDEKISDLEKLTYPARIEDLRAVLAIVEARAAKSSAHAKVSEPRINFLKWAITEKENGMMGAGQRPSLDAENMTPMAVHEALVSGYMLNRHGETVWVARKKSAGIDTYVVMSKEQDGSVTFTKGPVGPSRDIGWGLAEAAQKAVASWDFDTVPVIEAQIAEQDAILDGILDRLAAQGMVQDDRLIASRNAVERNLEELRERLRAKWRDEAQTSPAVADFVEGRTDQPPTIEDVDAEQRQALANIFEGLSGRGLMRSKAEVQAQASPYASQIAKVESQFHDALIRLMEAGQLKVNGASTVTEENSKCL